MPCTPRSRGGAIVALLILSTLLSPTTGAQSFTLEQVMSSAFPVELTASPAGDRLAWLANAEGRRDVWGAEAPGWEPRALTSYGSDDGRELSGLAFTPDGSHLVYSRGSAPNRDGELSNPTSDPRGVSRDLWMVAWAGGDPVRLAGAVDPLMSPIEPVVIWGSRGQCLRLDLGPVMAGGTPPRPEVLFTVRRDLSDPAWSPDGTRIAFASRRDGRSILGVYDLREESLRWLTNGVDTDLQPRWSRDGTRLAFVRQPVEHPGFAIGVVDAATGEAVELWRSPGDGTGYYPETIAGSYDLMYADGCLVFAGEWSGWNHLYTLPDTGGELCELTPGEGIVENACLDPDGRSVWVSGNTAGIDFRQLSRIRLSDGATEWIERGEAIAWNPVPFSSGTGSELLAYLRSDAREPAGVYLKSGNRNPRRISPLPDDFPRRGLVVPETVVFTAPDGLEIHGQLFLPAGRRGDRAPAVIFMHGGSRRQMMPGWHNRGYYHHAYAFNQYLAAKGYVVLSVNYRSGIGYGVAFREPDDYGWQGASEYQDIVAAARFLQEHPRVDPDRIGLWGGSYGGYLTALGLARNSDLFAAGVDLHGVHNWADQLAWWGGGEIPAPSEAARDSIAALAYRSSPVADIASWRSPVLIVHGDDDRNVPFEASIDLVRRLRLKGDVICSELYFPDEAHGFLRHRNWLEVFRRAADFFDRYLRDR